MTDPCALCDDPDCRVLCRLCAGRVDQHARHNHTPLPMLSDACRAREAAADVEGHPV